MPLRLSAALLLAAALPASAQEAGTTTGTEIDPAAYAGLWYEIARTPTPFQQQCEGGVTAFYEVLDPETLRVLNRCDTAGEPESIEGTADVLDGNLNTYSVEFPQSPDAPGINYVVAAVGPEQDGQYPWAAVHSPEGDLAWILSRTPELDAEARAQAEEALTQAGADPSALQDTAQPPEDYDPAQEG